MKYNPETNRCRGADPRVIGQMLGSDTESTVIGSCGCLARRVSRSAIPETCGACDNLSGNEAVASRRAGCGCNRQSAFVPNARIENSGHVNSLAFACDGAPSLAMVYSPHQMFDNLYSTEEALGHGTLFVELDKPWKAGGCR